MKEVVILNRPESLRDIVYKYLIQKIQNGEVKPGDKINESMICTELSLSRTPTREALIKLESDGFLSYTQNKGFSVNEIDEKGRNDVYLIIGTLDALAASLALDRIDGNDRMRMNELVDKMAIAIKYRNFPDYSTFQIEFHDIYVGKCNNAKLIAILDDLRRTFVPQTYISKSNADLFSCLEIANNQHRYIIELFEKKDIENLKKFLVDEHWRNYNDLK